MWCKISLSVEVGRMYSLGAPRPDFRKSLFSLSVCTFLLPYCFSFSLLTRAASSTLQFHALYFLVWSFFPRCMMFMYVSLHCPLLKCAIWCINKVHNDSASSRQPFCAALLSPQPSHMLFWERSTKKCGCAVQEMCPSPPCVNEMESMNLPELWAVNHLIAQTINSTNN